MTSQQDDVGVRIMLGSSVSVPRLVSTFLEFLFRFLSVHLRIPPPGPCPTLNPKGKGMACLSRGKLLSLRPNPLPPVACLNLPLRYTFPSSLELLLLSVNDELICK